MSHLLDRRAAPRKTAAPNEAKIRWPGADSGRAGGAQLLDASATGALIACDDRPGTEGPIWVRLIRPARTDWIAGRSPRDAGPGRLALEFDGPCPADFLLSATLGVGFDGLLAGLLPLDDGRSRDDYLFAPR